MRVRYFLSKNRKNVQSIIDRFFLGGGGRTDQRMDTSITSNKEGEVGN